MDNNFIKIKWFNTETSKWVSDYLIDNADYDLLFSIASSSNGSSYFFCVPEKLAHNINQVLIDILASINSQEHCLPMVEFKIINLSLYHHNSYVTGNFDLMFERNYYDKN